MMSYFIFPALGVVGCHFQLLFNSLKQRSSTLKNKKFALFQIQVWIHPPQWIQVWTHPPPTLTLKPSHKSQQASFVHSSGRNKQVHEVTWSAVKRTNDVLQYKLLRGQGRSSSGFLHWWKAGCSPCRLKSSFPSQNKLMFSGEAKTQTQASWMEQVFLSRSPATILTTSRAA